MKQTITHLEKNRLSTVSSVSLGELRATPSCHKCYSLCPANAFMPVPQPSFTQGSTFRNTRTHSPTHTNSHTHTCTHSHFHTYLSSYCWPAGPCSDTSHPGEPLPQLLLAPGWASSLLGHHIPSSPAHPTRV